MARKQKRELSYFEANPKIVKIFDDLEEYHWFCRFEMIEFDPAALYNRSHKNWRFFEYTKRNKARKAAGKKAS